MLSSTSSSDAPLNQSAAQLRRAAATLIVSVVLVAAALECSTRLFVHRMSANLGRISQEASAAEHLRRTEQAPRQLLIVGNSLLLADVDMAALNRGLHPQWQATRFAVEQTAYYDWHFGLRRLLAAGARPDAVVMCLEPRHLISEGIRNEIFAYFLLQPSDIFRVSRTLRMSPTEASDLFFANTSAFYALRKEIRKNILGRLMPSLPSLTAMIARGSVPLPDPAVLSTTGKTRLEATRDVAISAESRLVLALTPPLRPIDWSALRSVGNDIGIPVLAPLLNDDLIPMDFEKDRYHLNERGRSKFTEMLIPLLVRALNAPAAQDPAVAVRRR
jgi:hypothetical protein